MDRAGGLLAVVVAAATTPEYQLLGRTLDTIVPPRPLPAADPSQELSGDRGDDHPSCDTAAAARGYSARIARTGGRWGRVDAPPPPAPPPYRRRRWIVERTLAWLSTCPALLVRYEKQAANYLGFVQVACILL